MRTYFAPQDQPELVKEALSYQGWTETDNAADAQLIFPRAGSHLGDWLRDWQPTQANQNLGVISKYRVLTCCRALWTQLELALGREQASKVMPESYLLDCIEHLEKLREDMKTGGTYFIKCTRQHQRRGLSLTNQWNDIETARRQQHMIAQRAVDNVFSVKQRRLSLRMYLVVTIRNDEIEAFVHSDGKCLYCPERSQGNMLEFDSMVTRQSNVTTDLPFSTMDLKEHLNLQGIKWENVEQQIKRIMTNAVSCVAERWQREFRFGDLSAFQIFGFDIILTDDIQARLIEINPGPVLSANSDRDKQLKRTVLADMLRVVGLSRSQSDHRFARLAL